MEQIREFFSDLFTTAHWPARWRCGYWSDFHGWLYIISDLMIWLAYFAIPLIILTYFTRKKSGIRYRKVYLLFASFILLCGTTHFLDALMFWVPAYRINALVRLATGLVSLTTVYYLIKILPEAFRQRTSGDLEREIAQRELAEERLARANQELAEANKGLEAFAYVASHDLQEPLRKIKTFGEMVERNAEMNEQGRLYMDRIKAASSRMSVLIDEVLSLSRISGEVALTPMDPNRAVEKAINDLEIKIRETGADIQVDAMPKVLGNEAYLTQLFANLINNAMKFNTNTPQVRITSEVVNHRVVIRVADNGIGIDSEFANKIFEPFQRLHGRHEFEGSGIGLAICKKIVDVHNGRIYVESEKGAGSTFVIELPWPFINK